MLTFTATSVWDHDVVRFLRSLARDLVKTAAILIGLEVIWQLIKWMELSGYPSERLEYFERVHFCAALAAVFLLSLAFLVKLAVGLFREARNG